MSSKAKSNAERQRVYRQRQKDKGIFSIKVKGKDGYYDERIRIAEALHIMAIKELINEELLDEIIEMAINVIPPKNRIDRIYLKRKLNEFLKGEK
jgi:hypothetical protein